MRNTAFLTATASVFGLDLALKVFARAFLPTGERFAFDTPVGAVGFVPSMNDVLAFSLPIPNAWIWPIGWVIVAVLIALFLRGGKSEIRNPKSETDTSECHPEESATREPVHHLRISACIHGFLRFAQDDPSGRFRISSFGFRASYREVALLAMILGAISNLLDRTLRGGVTDYLALTSLFPAFNIADLLIIGGVVGWLFPRTAERKPATTAGA